MPRSIPSRQFWIQSPGRGEILSRELPAVVQGALRIRTLFSGISRGTEGLVFRGEVPASQHEALRAPFQEGGFPGPVKYGYCNVGRVEAVPDRLPRHLPPDLLGRDVFVLYPHQDLYWVLPDAVTPLPPDVPPERAVLAANMETAVNVVWDGAPAPGDRIVVVGAGVVGLLVAWLCRPIPGCRVTLVDVDPGRAAIAAALDLDFAADGGQRLDPGSADLVFHASGNPDGLVRSLELAADEATVVEASWFGTRKVTLPLGEAFHSRRLNLRSSQVGRVPTHHAPRWSFQKRMELAVSLLEAPELDVLISGESDFEELPEVMPRLSASSVDTLCHRIRYGGA